MSASDWASFSIAGATLILAGITAWTAFEARRAVGAGIDEATATQLLGEEARIDRELAWRPYLAVETRGMGGQGVTSWKAKVGVLNVGGGPAIDCIVFMQRDGQTWAHSRVFSVASGHEQEVGLATTSTSAGPCPAVFSASDGAWRDPNLRHVVVASDIFGNRWRFPQGMVPEMHRRGALLVPEWSKWRP